MTSSSTPSYYSLLEEDLKQIEELHPWFRVESIKRVECNTSIFNYCYPPRIRYHVQILIIAAKSPSNTSIDQVSKLIGDDLVIRVELLFLQQAKDFPNSFDILSISKESSSSPVFFKTMRESQPIPSWMMAISQDSETAAWNADNRPELNLQTAYGILPKMAIIHKCLQRRLPGLVANACLYRYNIPVELHAIVTNYMNGIIFNDTSIQYAIRLWTTNRDIAMSQLGHISTWNTSQVTSMRDLFLDKGDFNDEITGWDVSNVTNMMGMFANASSFNQPIDCWKIDCVENVRFMFSGATSFNKTLPSWKETITECCDNHGDMFDYGTRWNVLGEEALTHKPTYISNMPSDELIEIYMQTIGGSAIKGRFKKSDTIYKIKQYIAKSIPGIEQESIWIRHMRRVRDQANVELHDYLTIEQANLEDHSGVHWECKVQVHNSGNNVGILVDNALLGYFGM